MILIAAVGSGAYLLWEVPSGGPMGWERFTTYGGLWALVFGVPGVCGAVMLVNMVKCQRGHEGGLSWVQAFFGFLTFWVGGWYGFAALTVIVMGGNMGTRMLIAAAMTMMFGALVGSYWW